MRLRMGARTDIGRFRERNEDAYLADDLLFAVADGMGGHRGGDVASTMALEVLQAGRGKDGGLEDLAQLIEEANRTILARGSADHRLTGMGTTLTAALAEGDRVHIAHVGDSRAYLLRDGNIQQLTEDHTLVQRMVREGRLTPEEAERHPQRSILTQALGVDEEVAPERLTLNVQPGDRLLLCTDGLTGMVDREQILQILANEPDPQRAAEALVDAANQAGGDDNITVLVIEVEEGDQDEALRAGAAAAVSPDGGKGTEARGRGEGEAPEEAARPREFRLRLPRPHVNWRKLLIGTVIVAALLVVAWIGARAYINSQWYVGDADGRVAIYNGIPTEVLGYELSNVEQLTELPTQQAARLRTWRGLPEGITADSLEEARAIVDQIRLDLSLEAERR